MLRRITDLTQIAVAPGPLSVWLHTRQQIVSPGIWLAMLEQEAWILPDGRLILAVALPTGRFVASLQVAPFDWRWVTDPPHHTLDSQD